MYVYTYIYSVLGIVCVYTHNFVNMLNLVRMCIHTIL